MAQEKTYLDATIRTEFGKGAARRIRREDKIPAVLYGHGEKPVHLELEGHATMLAVKNPNNLLTIRYDGKEELALARDVQREILRRITDAARGGWPPPSLPRARTWTSVPSPTSCSPT